MAPSATKTFDDLDGEFCKDEVDVRLIHFWEVRNHTRGNALLGIELLFIDTKSTTIQGFIPANRIFCYEDSLKRNALYKLKNFIINPRKKVYRVSDHKSAIFFTNQTSLNEITNEDQQLDLQKFRIHPYTDFAAIADQNGDLYEEMKNALMVNDDHRFVAEKLEKKFSITQKIYISKRKKSVIECVCTKFKLISRE